MVVHRVYEDGVRFVGSPPVPSAVGLFYDENADDKAKNSSALTISHAKATVPTTASVGDLGESVNGKPTVSKTVTRSSTLCSPASPVYTKL